ncbi:unnamed protein product [Chironomus riparius]|uniref:Peptidase S1 domain-containing protein n=1 Tax=Chironomus riparius TaxID=315576 RepID=A0A9N9WUZ7_9DIPT|nr:unnamed protein product [Chironomus riparius]
MNPAILFLVIFSTLSLYTKAQRSYPACGDQEECTVHTACDEFKKLTVKGFLTKDERKYFSSKLCKNINHIYHVCCARKMDETRTTVLSLTTESTLQTEPSLQTEPTLQTEHTQPTIPRSKLPTAPNCGFHIDNRIVGGVETSIEDYPWIAKILYLKSNNKTGSHCGGSLINERYVLSAAHCERRIPPSWKLTAVRLGDWDTRTNPDCQKFNNEELCNDPYVDVDVIEIIVHPEYIPLSPSQPNDIMMLKLKDTVEFSKWIKPICLPHDPSVGGIDFTKLSLEVAGFGKTDNATSSNVKMRLDVDGVDQERCTGYYGPKSVSITSYQICAGGVEGRDSCNGDSGGPLMRSGSFPNTIYPHFLLVGIVSFGPKKCGTKDAPGVYTRVSEYIDWINSNIN